MNGIDPILPFLEIIKRDTTLERIRANVTVEDLQKDIATIQLIPETTENVRHLFRIAKDLYIYGYFKYAFFKVSNHYASLALEVAIKTKYVRSLGERVIITYEGQERVLFEPTWWDIDKSCYTKRFIYDKRKKMSVKKEDRWKMKKVKVNGQRFRATMSQLLKWLINNRIINKQQREEIEVLIDLRNRYSHPEFPSVEVPDSRILEKVAHYINILMAQYEPSHV